MVPGLACKKCSGSESDTHDAEEEGEEGEVKEGDWEVD